MDGELVVEITESILRAAGMLLTHQSTVDKALEAGQLTQQEYEIATQLVSDRWPSDNGDVLEAARRLAK